MLYAGCGAMPCPSAPPGAPEKEGGGRIMGGGASPGAPGPGGLNMPGGPPLPGTGPPGGAGTRPNCGGCPMPMGGFMPGGAPWPNAAGEGPIGRGPLGGPPPNWPPAAPGGAVPKGSRMPGRAWRVATLLLRIVPLLLRRAVAQAARVAIEQRLMLCWLRPPSDAGLRAQNSHYSHQLSLSG